MPDVPEDCRTFGHEVVRFAGNERSPTSLTPTGKDRPNPCD
jgi:hypothetical protein